MLLKENGKNENVLNGWQLRCLVFIFDETEWVDGWMDGWMDG